MIANLRRARAGRTNVLVSNRVAALSWADHIVVMEAGAIVEEGTHESLVSAGGLYAAVARRQSLEASLAGR